MKNYLALLVIALTLAFSSNAFSALYKRVDSDGRITYSNIKTKNSFEIMLCEPKDKKCIEDYNKRQPPKQTEEQKKVEEVANSAYSDAYTAYESGNYTQAVKLFKPLALKGDISAQQNMGYLYANGLGVTQDYVEAVSWYKLAAALGHPKAQFNLGIAYTKGQGVAQDYIKAHMWFNLLSKVGDKESRHYMGEVAKLMTEQQIAQAQKLARECLARKYKGC